MLRPGVENLLRSKSARNRLCQFFQTCQLTVCWDSCSCIDLYYTDYTNILWLYSLFFGVFSLFASCGCMDVLFVSFQSMPCSVWFTCPFVLSKVEIHIASLLQKWPVSEAKTCGYILASLGTPQLLYYGLTCFRLDSPFFGTQCGEWNPPELGSQARAYFAIAKEGEEDQDGEKPRTNKWTKWTWEFRRPVRQLERIPDLAPG